MARRFLSGGTSMAPDARKRTPKPAVVAALYERTGMPLSALAERIGIAERTLRSYKSAAGSHLDIPYPVQYCIEVIADAEDARRASGGKHNRKISATRRDGGAQARRF
jgi:uncharacterized protein YjcR